MKLARIFIASVSAIVVVSSPLTTGMAQESGESVPVAPQRSQMTTPEAPFDMRAKDADALMKQLGVQERRSATAREKNKGVTKAHGETQKSGGGVTRTISVATPKVVNTTPYFRFRNATGSSPGVKPERTLQERRAAVEAYRQSLRKKSGP